MPPDFVALHPELPKNTKLIMVREKRKKRE
jgi:hypothetical protein